MTTTEKIYEFALFSIKHSQYNKYIRSYPEFQQFVESLKGFNALFTFQDVNNKNLVLDHAIWDSLSDVQAADNELQTNPECKLLLEPMEQVLLFENTIMIEERRASDIDDYSIVELNVYNTDENNHGEFLYAKKTFYNKVFDEAEGLVFIESFKSVISNNTYIDKFAWHSKQQADNAHEQFEVSKELTEFKETVNEMKYFYQLKPIERIK